MCRIPLTVVLLAYIFVTRINFTSNFHLRNVLPSFSNVQTTKLGIGMSKNSVKFLNLVNIDFICSVHQNEQNSDVDMFSDSE